MREIIYKKPEDTRPVADTKCPKCQGELRHDSIPCPDGPKKTEWPGVYEGCLVMHYGYVCQSCGSVFE